MKKYNIYLEKGKNILQTEDETSCSIFKDSSTFLRGYVCKNVKTKIDFNFINVSEHNTILGFFITIFKAKSQNIYYGFDSTAFCIVKSNKKLILNLRYLIYGKLSKKKYYFIDLLEAEPIYYKELCYWLL